MAKQFEDLSPLKGVFATLAMFFFWPIGVGVLGMDFIAYALFGVEPMWERSVWLKKRRGELKREETASGVQDG